MPLHVDARPAKFSEVIGNKAMIDSLQSTVRRKDHPHSYLFTGPSGCGKTTLARIVAAELGCSEQDLSEINMSNNRGIDTARDIIDQMRYRPLGGSSRVFLLDECHKSTPDFQNALLKALEEPPAHVYFLLCTTEPEKLLTTIKNRCATFTVTKLPLDVMTRFLKRTCHVNKIAVEDALLTELIREAEGCPRQALVMLEQIRDSENKETALEALRAIKVDEKQVIDLCRALIGKQAWPEVSAIIKGISGDDYEKVRRAVLGYAASVLLNKASNQAALIIDCFKEPFFNTGKAGLVAACYEVVVG